MYNVTDIKKNLKEILDKKEPFLIVRRKKVEAVIVPYHQYLRMMGLESKETQEKAIKRGKDFLKKRMKDFHGLLETTLPDL